MKRFIRYVRDSLIPASVLVTAVLLCVAAPVSCKSGAAGMTLLKGDFTSPQIVCVDVEDSTSVSLGFDRPVAQASCIIRPEGAQSFEDTDVSWDEPHTRAVFSVASPFTAGSRYVISGSVTDTSGNTLTLSIPFFGYNANVAHLVLTEVRNAYSSKKQQYEYVTLYCLKAGNLAGLELVNAGDGEQNAYLFPAIEIQKGDCVTVHLRKMKSAESGEYMQRGMIDECEGRKDRSFAVDSSDSAWDFWVENEKSRLAPSDILILRDRNHNAVMDALLYADPKNESEEWPASYGPFVKEIQQSGLWTDASGAPDASRDGAFLADGITSSAVTRTIRRKDYAKLEAVYPPVSCAADWTVYAKPSARGRKK